MKSRNFQDILVVCIRALSHICFVEPVVKQHQVELSICSCVPDFHVETGVLARTRCSKAADFYLLSTLPHNRGPTLPVQFHDSLSDGPHHSPLVTPYALRFMGFSNYTSLDSNHTSTSGCAPVYRERLQANRE